MEEAEIRLFIYLLQENLICTSLRDEVRTQTESADVGASRRKIKKNVNYFLL